MKRAVLRIASVLVGALFIYAGAIKALHPAQFADDIQNYRLLPWTIAAAGALYLPWLEIVCGLALLLRRAEGGALWVLAALTLVFIAALLSAQWRGLDIACGCFGHEEGRGLFWPLARDAGLLGTLAWLIWNE